MKLVAFNFVINYKQGKDNIVADALSRQQDDVASLNVVHQFNQLCPLSVDVPNLPEAVKEFVLKSELVKEMHSGQTSVTLEGYV